MMKKAVTAMFVIGLFLPAAVAFAQSGLVVNVTVTCGEGAVFEVDLGNGAGPYTMTWDFGDGVIEEYTYPDTISVSHHYNVGGSYTWSLTLEEGGEIIESRGGGVTIDGPSVNLISDPFPPLLDLESGNTLVNFTAEVGGDPAAYIYTWDLDGDGTPDAVSSEGEPNKASYEYGSEGKFVASVTVQDACGVTAKDTMPVVVETEGAEGEEGEKGCHPVAQKIANAITELFALERAESWYTCEEIFDIFTGDGTGPHIGFGRLKKAVKLVDTIDDLSWEEIRDWKLDGKGWGLLVQLDRFADSLNEISDEYGIRGLIELMENDGITLGEIRTALKYAVRYGSNFDDALTRLGDGASPGALGQLYRTADELAVDPAIIDEYMGMGIKLSDLRHASRLAAQIDADWQTLLTVRAAGYDWVDIKQAYKFADGRISAEEILAMGVNEYRKQARQDAKAGQEDAKNQRTAEQIASRFGVSEESVWAVFKGTCSFDWGCVRKHFQGK